MKGHRLNVRKAVGWMDGHGEGIRTCLYTICKAERARPHPRKLRTQHDGEYPTVDHNLGAQPTLPE
ncbi:hypothetical protein DV517_64940 [Streptomyces sp. S816]|nr:hypothetical protein DV517_64940 [Streptomyces sp. S816]